MPRADLNILCWEGYDDPAVLDPFAVEHGITARGEAHVSDAATADRLIDGEAADWDVINLNNPFVRDVLYPRGLIHELDAARFGPHVERWLPQFADLYRWAASPDGDAILGICQRFGPFNLVINSERMSQAMAEDQGFGLVADAANAGRYGILEYDDFNVFHICIGAGLDPFAAMDAADLDRFSFNAAAWFGGAAIVTPDHLAMNRALVDGDIDFYLSGGVFSASAARFDGHDNIRAITPQGGPMGGKGGIVFAEITAVIAGDRDLQLAEDFLAYLLRPEVAVAVAVTEGTINPVVQMADPAVRAAFSSAHLSAIQWDTIEEEISRCAHYRVAPDYAALFERMSLAKAAARQR